MITLSSVIQDVYAFLAGESTLERIGGGSETDVYRSTDARFVIKLKDVRETDLAVALAETMAMRNSARQFSAYLGPQHAIPTYFLVTADRDGKLCIVSIQPYLQMARPLAVLDFQALPPKQWVQIERQLLAVLRRSLRCYHRTGHMPDLYGVFSQSVAQRRYMNTPAMWLQRVRFFLTQRLSQAHNLVVTPGTQPQVILVDYDRVRWRGYRGRIYYALCWLMFWRELLWLAGWTVTTLVEEEITDAVSVDKTMEVNDAILEFNENNVAAGEPYGSLCTGGICAWRDRGDRNCLCDGSGDEPRGLVVLRYPGAENEPGTPRQ
jgi:hypothetical protein